MEWQEINCLIEGLELLVEKHKMALENTGLNDDGRSDISNDLAYTEILLGAYNDKRNEILRGVDKT